MPQVQKQRRREHRDAVHHRVVDGQVPDQKRRRAQTERRDRGDGPVEVAPQHAIDQNQADEAVQQGREADRPLVRVVVAVGAQIGAQHVERADPRVAGDEERRPEDGRTERVLTRAVAAEDLLVVGEIQIAVHDQRPDLHEVRTAVGSGAFETDVEQQEQQEEERDEDETGRVEPRCLPHQAAARRRRDATRNRPGGQDQRERRQQPPDEDGRRVPADPEQRHVPDRGGNQRKGEDRQTPGGSQATSSR
jgi:hypothetical protein